MSQPAANQLEFRHGLIREVAYDDLLPEERARAHAKLADAVQARLNADDARPTVGGLGNLAFHRLAAHQLPDAFTTSMRAGLAAMWLGAPEAIEHFELSLELWDQVPAPLALGGVAQADVLRQLAEAAAAHGDWAKADRCLLAAIDQLVSDTDRLLASRVYSTYGMLWVGGTDRLTQREALERAVAYAEGSPSEAGLRTNILAKLGVPNRGEAAALARELVKPE